MVFSTNKLFGLIIFACWRTLPADPESMLIDDLCTVEVSIKERFKELPDYLLFWITMSLLLKEDIDIFCQQFLTMFSAAFVWLIFQPAEILLSGWYLLAISLQFIVITFFSSSARYLTFIIFNHPSILGISLKFVILASRICKNSLLLSKSIPSLQYSLQNLNKQEVNCSFLLYPCNTLCISTISH